MVLERRRPVVVKALALVAALFVSTPALAQSSAADEARAYFVEGYALVESGDIDAAILAFERAYAKSPHFAVLYNLGQAYASVGRSVEAVEKLELYLSLGADAIPEERKRQVREVIAYQSRRIGEVMLDVTPAGAEISFDGAPAGQAPIRTPLRATSGVHAVSVTHPEFERQVALVEVVPRRTTELRLRLAPIRKSELVVQCDVPDAVLELEGKRFELKLEKRQTLSLESGTHEVSFSRPGYVSRRVTISVAGAETTPLPCALEVDPNYRSTSRLQVKHPRGTRVLVDGRPHTRSPLPRGRHRVSVVGTGYDPTELIVSLGPAASRLLEITPRPSSSVLASKQRDAEGSRRTAGLIVGGFGAASTLAALAVYLVNDATYDRWQSQNAALIARIRNEPSTVTPRDVDNYLKRENRIRNWDTVAVGLGVAGVVSLAGAAALLWWSDAPPPTTVTQRGAGLHWAF
jgi:hypothetical protein